MKIKKSKIDNHGLCLNEYKNNKNNAEVYFKRSVGASPEMETSKAMASLIGKKLKIIIKFRMLVCYWPFL